MEKTNLSGDAYLDEAVYRGLPEDARASKYKKQILLNVSLGIMQVKYRLFDTGGRLSRGELAYAAAAMLGIKDETSLSGSHDYYKDVAPSGQYYKEIQAATNAGVIDGVGNGLFDPNSPVDADMLSKALSSMLGYDVYAAQKGGYPVGYRLAAAEVGLFRGVDAGALNRETAAAIFANALDSGIMARTSYGNGAKYEKTGETLLYSGMGIDTANGKVEAVGATSLFEGGGLSGRLIKIGGTIYNIENGADFLPYLGLSVKAYYKTDDGERRAVFIMPGGGNKILSVGAGRIMPGTTRNEIIYEVSEEVLRRARVSRNADTVYNGRAGVVTDADVSPGSFFSGYVNLIDNDGDGDYDVMAVYKYQTYIALSADVYAHKLNVKGGETLDLNKYRNYSVIRDGAQADFSDIREWDVVSLAADKGNDEAVIYASSAKIEGTVEEIGEDYAVVSGQSCDFGNWYLKTGKPFPLVGERIRFSLDIDGKIAAINKGAVSGGKEYGYLTGIKNTNSISAPKIQLYSASGSLIALECADKVSLNGISRPASDVLSDPRLISSDKIAVQLVRYGTNGAGKLSAVDIAVRKVDLESFVPLSELTAAERAIAEARRSEEAAVFGDGGFTFNINGESLKIRRGNMSFSSKAFYGSDSIAVLAPSEGDSLSDENNYALYGASELSARSTQQFTVYAYDADDLNVSRAFVLKGAGAGDKPDELSNVFVAGKKVNFYDNADGEAKLKLYGTQKGSSLEITPKTDTIARIMSEIAPGDVLQIAADDRNRVGAVEKRFSPLYAVRDLDDGKLDNVPSGGKPFDAFDYHVGGDDASYEHICGIVEAVGDERCLIRTSKGGVEEVAAIVFLQTASFALYDAALNRASPSRKEDIYKGALIYARVETAFLRDVVIFVNTDRLREVILYG
jgi:hypothetical protein